MAPRTHFNLRVQPATLAALERQAVRRGEPKSTYAAQLLDEAVRSADHPGIAFRDGPAGRRASLAGRRLDVWQIVETLHDNHGEAATTAAYHELSAAQIDAAIGYYADFKDEIDGLIRRNEEMAAESEAAARRRAAVLNE
ncbi:MAG: hypothetical protein NVS3B18_06780 [Candidatus Dormibacteria bacterium]